MTNKFKQAYQQAPWRRQLRSFGISVLPVIAIGLVIALYLVVSAQSAAAGLQIMGMHYDEEEILRQIAIHRTELGWMTSYNEMQKRARKIGYDIPPAEAVHFMTIPGYQGQGAVLIAPPPGADAQGAPLVNEFYQQSLWDWFVDTFLVDSTAASGGVK
ncbi:MAG: hypothetical protein MUO42_12630 [Anaerolineaceae bacterium]|jgi:hypothetical protein|nr:hypothetical protein [Anaerolineaceae bacterium]